MKNYEKYLEEIIDSLGVNGLDCGFIHKRVFHEQTCNGRTCSNCNVRCKEWLKEEYKPQIDWSKVPVDTPVIVYLCGDECHRHFAKYENGLIYTFDCGRTSWSKEITSLCGWRVKENLVKLAREEDIEKYSI